MPDFIPLEQISQMSGEERAFLTERCGVTMGYFDAEKNEFVIGKRS